MNLSSKSLLILIGVTSFSTLDAQTETRKNLVVIMADQWRGNALGFLGREAVQTPHLDKFAKRSVVVEQCISAYPVSSPARAMFLTGAYPWKNGVLGNCNSETAPQNVELRQDIDTWSDVLQKQGYALGYIGKWHLDKPIPPYIDTSNNRGKIAWNEWCPPERRHGFEHWIAYGTYDNHLRPMYWNNPKHRDDWAYVDQWGPEYETDRAIEFIENNSDQPFALMVSMNPPHTAYELVPDKYKDTYKNLNTDSIADAWLNIDKERSFFKQSLPDYYACMTGVDEQIGRLLDELDRRNLFDNTIVIFTSDHGDVMGTHNHRGKNVYYEEAVHVPMLIGGGGLSPRRDKKLLMSLEDTAPTLLSLLGFSSSIPKSVQTKDLSKQIKGESDHNPDGQIYVRCWSYGNIETNNCRGWRNERYTYASTLENGSVSNEVLFDREQDPFQLKNVISEHPEIANKMREEMLSRLQEIKDPLLTQ